MILRETYEPLDLKSIENLYLNAFPLDERKPFPLILEKCREGSMQILKIEDDAKNFLGLVIMILHNNLAILDYFAMDPSKRNNGYGSQVLALLTERYANYRMILEIENPDVPSDNRTERIRRKAFYLRNGMRLMPFKVNLFDVEMLILTNGDPVTFDEYHSIFVNVFSPLVSEKIRLI